MNTNDENQEDLTKNFISILSNKEIIISDHKIDADNQGQSRHDQLTCEHEIHEKAINDEKRGKYDIRDVTGEKSAESLNKIRMKAENGAAVSTVGSSMTLDDPPAYHQVFRRGTELSAFDYNIEMDEVVERHLQSEAQRAKKRKVKKYFSRQAELMRNFKMDRRFAKNEGGSSKDSSHCDAIDDKTKAQARVERLKSILTRLTLAVNLALFIAKLVAAILSGSLSVLSSMVDSAMDLTTGTIMFCTNRAINTKNLRKYPRGRTRLEPLAVIVISVIMGAANVQLVVQSLDSMIRQTRNSQADVGTLVIMGSVVALKLSMALLCYKYSSESPSIRVLFRDHRNDCLSNTVAIVCATLASKVWSSMDSIGAMLVSFYIIFTWVSTGLQHVRIASGRAAESDIINRIIKICVDHEPEILSVDTVYAYYFGIKYMVEVHIVLSEEMTLKEAHDISEALHDKIERLPFVERAYLHITYRNAHALCVE